MLVISDSEKIPNDITTNLITVKLSLFILNLIRSQPIDRHPIKYFINRIKFN